MSLRHVYVLWLEKVDLFDYGGVFDQELSVFLLGTAFGKVPTGRDCLFVK